MLGVLFAGAVLPPAAIQAEDEELRIYTEHPRIFLRPQRLKLLKRERERGSIRWQQFEALLSGRAPMPEPGFAKALYYRISGDSGAGREAVAWALGPGTDLRQLALVFDWCQDLLGEAPSRALAAKLQNGIEQSRSDTGIAAVRSRLLAAAALADHLPQVSNAGLKNAIRDWWEARIVPALHSGRFAIGSNDAGALFEILHVVRDNLNIDLREASPDYFKNLPVDRVSSYYPAPFQSPYGPFRIPACHDRGAPDFGAAAGSRAAELSMVAYDANSTETQVLQGWLMHNRFIMKDPFGVPYEFLWANPYQPGLSYYHLPLIYHDEKFGRLFLRSDWDESAEWLGFLDGELQRFHNGKLTVSSPPFSPSPILLAGAVVLFEVSAGKFKIPVRQEEEKVFIVGLKPGKKYAVEVEHKGTIDSLTDPAGILELELPQGAEVGVRLRESGN